MNLEQETKWLLEEKYSGEKSDAFFSDLERLKAGEPLAYLIGSIPFLNCKIYLDSRPLIPRTETEFWVEKVISKIQEVISTNGKNLRILDLCAGSGVVGVAIGKAVEKTDIDFIELDIAHLPTITKNCVKNQITNERVKVMAGDLFDLALPEQLSTYDFIVSNPPYIDPNLDRTEQSVKNHEPEIALYGGIHGLEIITKIIKQAPQFLNKGGQLWIEHEPEQTEVINILAKPNFTCSTKNDQYGIERYSVLVLQ